MKISQSFGVVTTFALRLRAWISDASKFSQLLNVSNRYVSLSKFAPRTMHIRGIRLLKLSQKSDDIQQMLRKGITRPSSGAPNRHSQGVFPFCQEILNISQTATVFHTADVPSFTLRTAQFMSSRIDEVYKFDDSMIDLHKICQIPTNCQCKRLSAFQTVRESSVLFSVS